MTKNLENYVRKQRKIEHWRFIKSLRELYPRETLIYLLDDTFKKYKRRNKRDFINQLKFLGKLRNFKR